MKVAVVGIRGMGQTHLRGIMKGGVARQVVGCDTCYANQPMRAKYLLYQRQQRQAKILQCQKKKRGVAQSVHYIFVKRYGKRGWIRPSNIIVGNINDVKRCMSFYRKVSIPNPDFRPLQ